MQQNQAFTLVELIVVITILAILGTISFISLQGYSQSARDSVRISDLSNISKGLELQLTKGGKVSIPEDKVDITASGVLISYQGYAGKQILQNIGVHGGGKDPVDNNYYTYTTNTSFSKYQIMGFLENELEISLLNNTFSEDYLSRFPIVRGDNLGILLSSGSLVPIQVSGIGVDIINTNNSYKAYINNESADIVSGTGISLQIGLGYRINEKGSCISILKNGKNKGDGIYSINPTGTGSFEVYCDMTTDGGGWTLITENMVEENNFSLSSTITNDINGGLVYQLSSFLNGCGSAESRQELKLPNNIIWKNIRFKQEFYRGASCWNIFGKKGNLNIYDTNIIPFELGIDIIRNQVRMGGSNGDDFDGITNKCNNNTTNFFHSINGANSRFAEVILRRDNINIDSYLSTQLSCVNSLSYIEYSNIYIK